MQVAGRAVVPVTSLHQVTAGPVVCLWWRLTAAEPSLKAQSDELRTAGGQNLGLARPHFALIIVHQYVGLLSLVQAMAFHPLEQTSLAVHPSKMPATAAATPRSTLTSSSYYASPTSSTMTQAWGHVFRTPS